MLESHAGQASVSLHLGLGTWTEEAQKPPVLKKVSPSRTRRRHRQAKARQDAADCVDNNVVKVTSEEDVSECVKETTEMVPSEEEASGVNAASHYITEEVDIVDEDVIDDVMDIEKSNLNFELEEEDSLSIQLEKMIKESQRSRDLWEKFSNMPP